MINRLTYGILAIWLTSCAIRPERGPAGGSDIVVPLWEDVSQDAVPAGSSRCDNVVALLIGIGQYKPATGWEPLQAQNDVAHLADVLKKQGVPARNIHSLLDHQATRAGIIQALQTLADTLRSGTHVLILYGGHARQIPDDNHDEADGQDEALVPFDAPPVSQTDVQGYLRDDELNQYFTRIRSTLGSTGLLWFLFDSCHSQTLNRGKTTHQRGGVAALKQARSATSVRYKSPGYSSEWFEKSTDRLGLAPYVLFAATTDGAPSFETTDAQGRSLGPLTRAVGETWMTVTAGETYRTFFNRVTAAMAQFAPYQQPTLEGDGNRAFASCVPRAVDASFRTRAEPVRITWPRTDRELTPLLTALPFVQPAATRPDIRIVRRSRGYTLVLPDAQPLTTTPVSAGECVEWIRQFFARNVLLNLHQTSPDFQVRATLQRLLVRDEGGQPIVTDTLPAESSAGVPAFRISADERMLLTLTNTGPKPFYVTVVDLLPDGKLHVLLPEADHASGEYQLQPGQSLRRRIRLTEPTGAEVYKLLLTPTPIALRSVLQTRGNQPVQHPYETLFDRIYTTRGAAKISPLSLSTRTGATADVAFWVEPHRVSVH